MKKIFKSLVIILLLLTILGCGCKPQGVTEKYVITIEYNNGYGNNEILIDQGSQLVIDEKLQYTGYDFCGWYLDKEFTIPLPSDYVPTGDTTVYAKWEVSKIAVTFYVDDDVYEEQIIDDKGYAVVPKEPEKQGYRFAYWSTTREGNTSFNFKKRVSKSTILYAYFKPVKFTVIYDLNYDAFYTKNDLYQAFFKDFYNFMLEKTDVDFSKFEIENEEDFLTFCMNWNANGKDSFYGVGDAFSKYYVTLDVGGTLENQPETTFIGYCYKNEKYTDFIPFLMQFFAYWRTDEGYTGGSSDPDNLGNDFFASAWASLVDTCKFFYFTSANLNDTYPWFNSERVKYALDNVPGVVENSMPSVGTIEDPIVFVEPVRKGYKFLGWYDENGNKVTEAYAAMTVQAKWEKE